MINIDSFFSELGIIKEAAQKCRSGSTPIRAANLAKKTHYDGRDKRTTKLSALDQSKIATPRLILDFLGKSSKAGKPLISTEGKILAGLGLGGGIIGKGEFDKYTLGRRVHEAQNQ